jgi:hypothetical protein
MPTMIRRAVGADMFKVYKLLRKSTLNNRALPLASRQRAFNPPWSSTEDYYGYLIEDSKAIVGFLGTMFTQRDIGGRSEEFCEIHSWYVQQEYRNQSLELLIRVLGEQRTKTIVNLTPTKTVYDLSRTLGFKDLESSIQLFYPVPVCCRNVCISTEPWFIADMISGASLKVFLDHINVPCIHLVLSTNEEGFSPPLYLMMKSMRRGRLQRFGRLLYVSDPARFAHLAGRICWRLCLKYGWLFIAGNSADFDGLEASTFTARVPREIPSQFLSKRVTGQDIGQLYSQPLLLGYKLH